MSFGCEWIVRFRLWICGRLAGVVSEIFWRAAPKFCCGVSCVAGDLRFIDVFIFVTSIWSCDGDWVCSLISPTSSPLIWSFTFALHCSFRHSTHSQNWKKTYWKSFRINILAPLSVAVNSILTNCNVKASYLDQTRQWTNHCEAHVLSNF